MLEVPTTMIAALGMTPVLPPSVSRNVRPVRSMEPDPVATTSLPTSLMLMMMPASDRPTISASAAAASTSRVVAFVMGDAPTVVVCRARTDKADATLDALVSGSVEPQRQRYQRTLGGCGSCCGYLGICHSCPDLSRSGEKGARPTSASPRRARLPPRGAPRPRPAPTDAEPLSGRWPSSTTGMRRQPSVRGSVGFHPTLHGFSCPEPEADGKRKN